MNNSQQIRICAIIPTYNNERTIFDVVCDVHNYLADIIVVNDGCSDNTANILDSIPFSVTIVNLEKNKGKGRALLEGFKTASRNGYTHAITIDADGQHFASDIPVLLAEMSNNPNGIIVGYRNLTERNMPRQNTFANKFSNFWFRVQTAVNLPDTQSGFRLYTLSSLKGLWIITSRYEAELELLVFAAWADKKITSVPVKVYYPPKEERVTHFRPYYDFARISILNTVLCVGSLIFGFPSIFVHKIIKSFS